MNPLVEARTAVLFAGDVLDDLLDLSAHAPSTDRMELRDDLVILEARVHGIRRQLEQQIKEES